MRLAPRRRGERAGRRHARHRRARRRRRDRRRSGGGVARARARRRRRGRAVHAHRRTRLVLRHGHHGRRQRSSTSCCSTRSATTPSSTSPSSPTPACRSRPGCRRWSCRAARASPSRCRTRCCARRASPRTCTRGPAASSPSRRRSSTDSSSTAPTRNGIALSPAPTAPATTWWIPAGSTRDGGRAQLALANFSSDDARVDVKAIVGRRAEACPCRRSGCRRRAWPWSTSTTGSRSTPTSRSSPPRARSTAAASRWWPSAGVVAAGVVEHRRGGTLGSTLTATRWVGARARRRRRDDASPSSTPVPSRSPPSCSPPTWSTDGSAPTSEPELAIPPGEAKTCASRCSAAGPVRDGRHRQPSRRGRADRRSATPAPRLSPALPDLLDHGADAMVVRLVIAVAHPRSPSAGSRWCLRRRPPERAAPRRVPGAEAARPRRLPAPRGAVAGRAVLVGRVRLVPGSRRRSSRRSSPTTSRRARSTPSTTATCTGATSSRRSR